MIELKKVYAGDKYLGSIGILEEDLTPEFIKLIKEDIENKKGWRKYHGVLDRKARKKWRT